MSNIDSKIRKARWLQIIRSIKDFKWAVLTGFIFITVSVGYIPTSSGIVTGVVVNSGYENTEEGNIIFIMVELRSGNRVRVNIPKKEAFKVGETVRIFESESLFFSRKSYKFINYAH